MRHLISCLLLTAAVIHAAPSRGQTPATQQQSADKTVADSSNFSRPTTPGRVTGLRINTIDESIRQMHKQQRAARQARGHSVSRRVFPPTKFTSPLIVLNLRVIANGYAENIKPRKIKEIMIYRQRNVIPVFSCLADFDILNFTCNVRRVPEKTFAQIAAENNIRADTLKYAINGCVLDDNQVNALRVWPGAIARVYSTPSPGDSSTVVVNVDIVPFGINSPPPDPNAIYIR